MKTTTALLTLAMGLAMGTAIAQDLDGSPRPPGGKGHRPPPSPVITALDLNHDGVLDADEIAKAPVSLKTLDKNGDGKLTPDEFMGPRRRGPGGPGGPGMGGRGGFGGPPPGDEAPPPPAAPAQQ